jgi:3',5'-nucleoside bisphosphate phosphatase
MKTRRLAAAALVIGAAAAAVVAVAVAAIGVVAALQVAALHAQVPPPVRHELRVPDLPGLKTLKGDFHLHSVFSDGRVWPSVHVQEAWRDGLDVIAFTEHAEYHPYAADVKVDGGRSYGVAKPLADQLGIILVPGVEITKPDPPAPLVLKDGPQHFNALFVTDANALHVPNDLMEALRRAKAQKAFVFWNHPRYRVARAEWFAPIARAFDEGLFQGMELVNGPDFYDEAYPWIDERRLTIFANSDAHDPIPPSGAGGSASASGGAHRPITLVFARDATLEGVREAFESRRTAAWLGDDVWGAEEHLRGLWNGAIVVETPVLTRGPGASPTLRIRNTSSISMKVAVRGAPGWFILESASPLVAESVALLRPAVTADAPIGEHRIELRLDVLNLHTGPDKHLSVVVPLTVRVSR